MLHPPTLLNPSLIQLGGLGQNLEFWSSVVLCARLCLLPRDSPPGLCPPQLHCPPCISTAHISALSTSSQEPGPGLWGTYTGDVGYLRGMPLEKRLEEAHPD